MFMIFNGIFVIIFFYFVLIVNGFLKLIVFRENGLMILNVLMKFREFMILFFQFIV